MVDIITEFQNSIDKCVTDNTPMTAQTFLDYINKINKYQKNEYMKNYIKDKESLRCPCSGIYKKHQLHIHRKSKRHLKYISENSIITVNH